MNHIELFRKLASNEKEIDYFLDLPGDEGKLFGFMYEWLICNPEINDKKVEIKRLFNRVRANYLGVKTQHLPEIFFEEDDFNALTLTILYFNCVIDNTKQNSYGIITRRMLKDSKFNLFENELDPYLRTSMVQQCSRKFESSFTPEINHINIDDYKDVYKYSFWKDINPQQDQTGKTNDDVKTIIGLFPKKNMKLWICDALEASLNDKNNSSTL